MPLLGWRYQFIGAPFKTCRFLFRFPVDVCFPLVLASQPLPYSAHPYLAYPVLFVVVPSFSFDTQFVSWFAPFPIRFCASRSPITPLRTPSDACPGDLCLLLFEPLPRRAPQEVLRSTFSFYCLRSARLRSQGVTQGIRGFCGRFLEMVLSYYFVHASGIK